MKLFKCKICKKAFALSVVQTDYFRRGKRTEFVCSFSCRAFCSLPTRRATQKLSLRILARAAVQRALKTGALVKAIKCEKCSKTPGTDAIGRSKIQAHHYKGYEHALKVQWLCLRCHRSADAQCVPRGESHGNAKLNNYIVRAIRSTPEYKGVCVRLAEQYEVDPETVREIRKRQSWGHIS